MDVWGMCLIFLQNSHDEFHFERGKKEISKQVVALFVKNFFFGKKN